MAAATAAESIGAMAEASECYGRALDIWHRVAEPAELASCTHLELVRRAARAADLSRDFDRAVDLGRRAVEDAAAEGDPFVEGATLFELCQYMWNAGAPGLDDMIDRALEVIPVDPPSVERARMEIRRANRLRMHKQRDQAHVLLRHAAETAHALGEPGVEADALATLGHDHAVFGDEQALDQMYRALALASDAEAGDVTVKILVNLTDLLLFMGRFDEAAALSIEGIPTVERYGLMSLHGILMQGNGLQALEPLGRWDEAQAIVEDLTRRLGGDSVHKWATALVGWGQIQILRGQYEAAAPLYVRGLELRSSGYYTGDVCQLGCGLIALGAHAAVEPISLEFVDACFQEMLANEASWAARLASIAAQHLVPSAR
jgi:tetratricopeptide (TPR) repeat protein